MMPWMRKRSVFLRLSEEADARLDELAKVAGDRSRAVDMLLRALTFEQASDLAEAQKERDADAELAWLRSH